jgi:hypothetical protein
MLGELLLPFLTAISLILLVMFLGSSFLVVKQNEYVVLNWRIPFLPGPGPGHFIAVGFQQGIQAKVYTAGVKFIPFVHIFAEIFHEPLREVPEGKYAVIIALDGEGPPAGRQLVAEKVVECDNYADGEKFLRNGGQRGIQITPPLPPGKYAISKFLFSMELIEPVVIKAREEEIEVLAGKKGKRQVPYIGIVTLNIGDEIPQDEKDRGRIIGKVVQGHSKFQNLRDHIRTPDSLPSDNYLEKGPQLETLGMGSYVLISPRVVQVDSVPIPYIKEGQVGVIISSVGTNPIDDEKKEESIPLPGQIAGGGTTSIKRSVGYVLKDEFKEVRRGIRPDVVNPGFVPLSLANPVAYKIVPVDTTQITIDWMTRGEFDQHQHQQPAIRLEPIMLVTQGGFTVPMKAELTLNISREKAPTVIAIAGSQQGLIHDVVVPFVTDIAGRIVSEVHISALVKGRENIRLRIEDAIRDGIGNYPVDLIAFRIIQLDFEKSPDKKTREYVDLLAEQENVEERKKLFKLLARLQRIRKVMKLAEATADNQDIMARATLQREAATIQAEVIGIRKEAIGGISPLAAAIADPDGVAGLVTALTRYITGGLRERELKNLNSSAELLGGSEAEEGEKK